MFKVRVKVDCANGVGAPQFATLCLSLAGVLDATICNDGALVLESTASLGASLHSLNLFLFVCFYKKRIVWTSVFISLSSHVLDSLAHQLLMWLPLTGTTGRLNDGCGADHVKTTQSAPKGMGTFEPNELCASFDGDADRLMSVALLLLCCASVCANSFLTSDDYILSLSCLIHNSGVSAFYI